MTSGNANDLRVATGDGSFTLYSERYGEHYHSTFGARNESVHVFIEAGLHYWLQDRMFRHVVPHQSFGVSRNRDGVSQNRHDVPLKGDASTDSSIGGQLPEHPVRVLEVGFGTGLNAWLTALEAERQGVHIEYEAIELFPLGIRQVRALNSDPLFGLLHEAPWDAETAISPYFTMHKRKVDLLTSSLPGPYDVVYFDAFSPKVQPELWEQAVFERIFTAMHSGGILTTYCAMGEVRRRMQRAGFTTEKIPGPVGKREMLRANMVLSPI